MNFADYIPLAMRTCKVFPDLVRNVEHSAIGIFTESGEIASEIKRVAIYGKPLTDEMRAHLREEIGDAAWYVAIGCNFIGIKQFSSAGNLSGNEELIDMVHSLGVAAGASCGMLMAWKLGGAKLGECIEGFREALDLAHDALVSLCKLLGFDFGEVLDENIAKLRLRYPDKYSDEAAEARADKGGLDHRSS